MNGPRWSDLPTRARTWRVLHAAWSIVQLGCLAQVWAAVFQRRRSAGTWASVALLGGEGAALAVGRGNCPVGPLQESWGDPVPFFELLLPPRAAKAAVPALFVVSLAAIAGLVLRAPGLRLRAAPPGSRNGAPIEAARKISRTCRSRTGGRRRPRAPA